MTTTNTAAASGAADLPEVTEDKQLRKLAACGPAYAPNGLVERRPIEYRRELEDQFMRGYRTAERRAHSFVVVPRVAPAQAVPSASVEQEAMQMLWDDQQQEEKEHYRNVARGAELPLYAIHHPEDIDKTKCRAVPAQPATPAQAGEYPELPEQDATTVGLGHVWNRHSMRAYVDADRAASSVYSRSMDLVRTFWQQHTQSDALNMTMAELHDDVELVIRAARRAAQAAPEGWVPCVITYEGQHPEEVAYGPKIMMERLKKWLDRYFELRAQAAPVVATILPSPANVGTAPKCLNLNDQAMWVLGWNECLDAARAHEQQP